MLQSLCSFSISTLPFTIFRAFPRSVKFFCSGMENFLNLGQEQFTNEIQLHAEKKKNFLRLL